MRHLEDALQMQCVQWFKTQYKHKMIFAIPNAGKRNVVEGHRLKRMGMLAGVPDLFIPEKLLWIELKIGKNKPTEAQELVQNQLREMGHNVYICYEFGEFVQIVKDHLPKPSAASHF